MNMIAAADRNWGIGYQGRLLVSIPSDMKFFREATLGKVVVMGRRTLESLPGGAALPGRTNLVLTANPHFQAKGVILCRSLPETLEKLKEYDSEAIYIIGGEQVFRQFLPCCDTVHVTKIDRAYQADAFFPDLDRLPEWQLAADSDEQTYFDLTYRFLLYRRK